MKRFIQPVGSRKSSYPKSVSIPTSCPTKKDFSLERPEEFHPDQICPCEGSCPRCQTVQAKLKISQPQDKYEQEADQVAEKIMRGPEVKAEALSQTPHLSSLPKQSTSVFPVQRECKTCASAEATKEKSAEEEEEPEILFAKSWEAGQPQDPPDLPVPNTVGQPLTEEIRNYFEPRFGQDFSQVRIHTDHWAHQAAQAVQARAFTWGDQLVFAQGEYAPESPAGRRLLAHELTHVVQQSQNPLVSSKDSLGNPSDLHISTLSSAPSLYRAEGEGAATTTTAPEASAEPTTCGQEGSCQGEDCTEIQIAWELALELVQQAIKDLEPGTRGEELKEKTLEALLWQFRTNEQDDIKKIWDNLKLIENRLKAGIEIFSCSDPDNHCNILGFIPGVVAYTYKGQRPITLCPVFFWQSLNSEAHTMIHEAGHNIGLPRAPEDNDVYTFGHEYRALSAEEAMNTTDAYANFALDNRESVPVRVAAGGTELRTGVAIIGQDVRFALTFGWSLEFNHPALSFINPIIGIESVFILDTGEQHHRSLVNFDLGARIAGRGARYYFDLHTGGFIGTEKGGPNMAGMLLDLSAHYMLGPVDLSAFYQQYFNLLSGQENFAIIGLGAAAPF